MEDRLIIGCCYYPEHWPETQMKNDIARIKALGFNTIRMGEFSWSMFEPREGEFHFEVLDEAIEIMKAEKKSGKILTIGFQPRMSVNMQRIKQIVESGELGKVYYIQSGGGRRMGIPTPYGTSVIAKDTGGIGAMGKEAYAFADFLKKAGMSVWQVLPMGPTGYGESPYQSSSVFAGNPMLIDLQKPVSYTHLTLPTN